VRMTKSSGASEGGSGIQRTQRLFGQRKRLARGELGAALGGQAPGL